jgi:hypothetical protein
VHFHSWQTALLPHLEQSALYARIDLTRAGSDPSNQENANAELSLFVCPSASNPTQSVRIYTPEQRYEGTAARTDYESIGGVPLSSDTEDVDGASMFVFTHAASGVWGLPRKNVHRAGKRTTSGVDLLYDGLDVASFRQVADGLSNTMIVGEIAGRPDLYEDGQFVRAYDSWGGGITSRPAWALSGNYFCLLLNKEERVNQTNRGGLFSFHPGGAHAALADCSIRFMDEATDPNVIAAMATRAGGEDEIAK